MCMNIRKYFDKCADSNHVTQSPKTATQFLLILVILSCHSCVKLKVIVENIVDDI